MSKDAERLRQTWETWAADDPLFAILSDPAKRGGKWTIDEFMAHTPELDEVLATVNRHGLLSGRSRALDFGCGVGRMTQALADRFDRVVGIDISKTMVEQARRLNRHPDSCEYVAGDISTFESGGFDFVFSIYVVQHIPKSLQRTVLRELVRVLKPAGVLAVQINSERPGIRRYASRLAPRWMKERRFRRRFGDAPLIEMNPMRRDEVVKAIKPATLELVDGEWYYIRPEKP